MILIEKDLILKKVHLQLEYQTLVIVPLRSLTFAYFLSIVHLVINR